MSIFVVWDEPHRTMMHIVYRPGWTEDDLHNTQVKAYTMLNQVEHMVDLFIDQQQMRLKPRDFLLHAQWLTPVTQHRNIRGVILMGVPEAFNGLRTINPHRENPFRNYFFAPTMDDAFEYVSETASV